jgi:hypothetical protein
MGYSIQPVTIWQNGQSSSGNFIDASIVNDNLNNYAQFYWVISSVTTNSEGEEIKQSLSQGNNSITGEDYVNWSDQPNVNLAAYQYICSQLNLTLQP